MSGDPVDDEAVFENELPRALVRAPEVRGEVLSGPERRRRWSTEEKLRVLAQSVAPRRNRGGIARRGEAARHRRCRRSVVAAVLSALS
jgi:hypothetical protein